MPVLFDAPVILLKLKSVVLVKIEALTSNNTHVFALNFVRNPLCLTYYSSEPQLATTCGFQYVKLYNQGFLAVPNTNGLKFFQGSAQIRRFAGHKQPDYKVIHSVSYISLWAGYSQVFTYLFWNVWHRKFWTSLDESHKNCIRSFPLSALKWRFLF